MQVKNKSTQENKVRTRRFLEEVWSQGNLFVVDELIAPDHIHHLTRRDFQGPEGVRQLVAYIRNFLPDLQITVKELIGEDDKVVAYFTFTGTDLGGYMGRPPSGKAVIYDGIDIFRFLDGEIVERWGIVDTLSMMHQIGAMP